MKIAIRLDKEDIVCVTIADNFAIKPPSKTIDAILLSPDAAQELMQALMRFTDFPPGPCAKEKCCANLP